MLEIIGLLILGSMVTLIVLQLRSRQAHSLVGEIHGEISKADKQLLQLEFKLDSLERSLEKVDRSLREEMGMSRGEAGIVARQAREEISLKLESMRTTIEERLRLLQEDNSRKLEEMRSTVNEKLHTALEQKLGESFKLVSERLEQVYKGLGEMQTLAVGVGDLKKVLSNVKTRGVFGEYQLGSILEDILTPDQYLKNVATRKGSTEVVEYAVKLPGTDDSGPVLLPIDAKFPQEDYLRLLEAYEAGDPSLIERTAKGLESRIRAQAKDICNKYISVPETTDFGIMFLPTESLYAEVLRRPGLLESLQREFRVNVTGPSTLAAFLGSLAVGFRTLAIRKHSSEVWTVLGAVKTEFNKYGDVLGRVLRQLQSAGNTLEEAQRRTRSIEKKLKDVEELPVQEDERVS